MILTAHIIIALSSIIFSTVLLVYPSRTKLHITYALTAATIASGTLLVITMPAHMISTCITGLVYLGGTLIAVLGAQYRLAKQDVRNKLD